MSPRIDIEVLLRHLRALLAIPSPVGVTGEVADYVAGALESLGLTTERTARGAVRARLPGPADGPGRVVAAHLDTLGAMISGRHDDGRFRLSSLGTWPARFAEGARVTVLSESGPFRGTILPARASGHIFGDAIDSQPGGWEHLALRLDHDGPEVRVGDPVAVDTNLEEHGGFICARHLDDKAGVAAILAALHAVGETSAPSWVLFTTSEEVGLGARTGLPDQATELVSVDIGPVGPGQASSERAVTVAFLDASGPFDVALSRRLCALAESAGISHVRDVYRYYRCDGAAAVESGHDVRTALLAFGADASHGYERTHRDALQALGDLLVTWLTARNNLHNRLR